MAALLAALAPTAAAQPAMGDLWRRLSVVDPAEATPANCDARVASASKLNALDLIRSASLCLAARRPVEGDFLLDAGQLRAVVDLSQMPPATKQDSDVTVGLYGVIYYDAGGPGEEEVLREGSSRERLFHLIGDWSPAFGDDYDPGWRARRRPDAAAYQAAISEAKAGRLSQLRDLARLLADPAYYTAEHRLNELQGRNPKGFVEGTEDAKLAAELTRQMSERAVALGVESPAPTPEEAAREAAQETPPPPAPEKDEVESPDSGPVAQHCEDLAESMAISEGGKIVGVLVTKAPKRGVIWRADISGTYPPMQRFTCTENQTSYLDTRGQNIEPLPPPANARRNRDSSG